MVQRKFPARSARGVISNRFRSISACVSFLAIVICGPAVRDASAQTLAQPGAAPATDRPALTAEKYLAMVDALSNSLQRASVGRIVGDSRRSPLLQILDTASGHGQRDYKISIGDLEWYLFACMEGVTDDNGQPIFDCRDAYLRDAIALYRQFDFFDTASAVWLNWPSKEKDGFVTYGEDPEKNDLAYGLRLATQQRRP